MFIDFIQATMKKNYVVFYVHLYSSINIDVVFIGFLMMYEA